MNELSLHLTPDSPSWPRELDEIEPAAEDLWLSGREELLGIGPRVAIVGSRAPTPYGEAQARRFAAALAGAGLVVVSGMARGIDEAAHRGALEAGGATLAVLGSGVDRPWPTGPLASELRRRGLLLSELAPGTGPRRHHFPLRNRIISGLARAVLVVEAAYASGSLITARWAVDQGRTVMALPGRVDHPMARGCHRLLQEGALLVESPEDVLREVFQLEATPEPRRAPETPLLRALRGETLSAGELAGRLCRDLPGVLSELVELELASRVVRCPGGLFRLP